MQLALSILLLLNATTAIASSAVPCWAGRPYFERPVPAAWISVITPNDQVVSTPSPTNNMQLIFSIPGATAAYGRPVLYLVSKRIHKNDPPYDLLVFRRSNGDFMAANVWAPPIQAIGAFSRYDKNCRNIGLVK